MKKTASIHQHIRFNLSRGLKNAQIFMVVLCLIPTLSCKQSGKAPQQEAKKDTGIHEKVERGPATVTLDVDRKEISIAERLNLDIAVTVNEDYEIKLPPFGEKLEQFGIVDYHTSQPKLTGQNRKTVSRSYILEPFLSGEYTIPAMTIMFWKKGDRAMPATEPDAHRIETPEVTVRVTSLLPEDLKAVKLNEILPPVPLPRSHMIWLWAAGGVILLALAFGGAMLWYKRRKSTALNGESQKPAHELAYESLQDLVRQDLIGKGEIKRFYQCVSDILRRYIENRFGLRAPEQTTEEFLAGLDRESNFPDQYKGLLNTFLRHCDLVKFAEYLPKTEDIQNTFDSCKAFIQGTEAEKE